MGSEQPEKPKNMVQVCGEKEEAKKKLTTFSVTDSIASSQLKRTIYLILYEV